MRIWGLFGSVFLTLPVFAQSSKAQEFTSLADVYQYEVASKSSTGSVYLMIFPAVPSGRVLRVNTVSCKINDNNTDNSIVLVSLNNTKNKAPAIYFNISTAYTDPTGTKKLKIVQSSDVNYYVESSQRPAIAAIQSGTASTSTISCTIAGMLSTVG